MSLVENEKVELRPVEHLHVRLAREQQFQLIRRLRTFCNRSATDTVCIGTSATLVDAEQGAEAGREFAARFFGVLAEDVILVGEEYQRDDWAAERRSPAAPPGHISDDEPYRFQLSVAIYGYEQGRHGPGRMHLWGERELAWRRNVYMRLVNIGAAQNVGKSLGYPMSLVTGQARTPFASQAELENFMQREQERYGRPIENVGLYADVIADVLSLSGCTDRVEAYSVLEALRVGMGQVLDMEREDLQVLVIGRVGDDQVDAILYDPMPGGSGLLEQACERWEEVVTAALRVLDDCPSLCERSCIDCLQTFRNAYFHRHLNRHIGAERLRDWGGSVQFAHDIPARLPRGVHRAPEIPVNLAERRLRELVENAHPPKDSGSTASISGSRSEPHVQTFSSRAKTISTGEPASTSTG